MGGERLDAVQLTYPAGGGPGGVTTTPRMGDSNGGSTQNPNGGIVDIGPGLAITQAYVSYGLQPHASGPDSPMVINTLQFVYTNNANVFLSDRFGGAVGQYQSGALTYPGYALSSIYIHGSAEGYPNTSADCIVFGFLRQR